MNTATTPRVRTIPEVTRELGTIEGSNRSEKSPRFTYASVHHVNTARHRSHTCRDETLQYPEKIFLPQPKESNPQQRIYGKTLNAESTQQHPISIMEQDSESPIFTTELTVFINGDVHNYYGLYFILAHSWDC